MSRNDEQIEAVREANATFYHAVESLDIRKMDPLWAKGEHVRCIHPGWSTRSGWREVRDSWVTIFNNTRAIRFAVDDVHVYLAGSLAWVVCLENIESDDGERWVESQVLATNLFENRDGRWLMIHHHGSPVFTTFQDAGSEEAFE
ncbi:MAG TPA: nuclear transport factor 2 family protein [Nitrospiria bacterium]|nr:nuclear transport factor 2 family protein [Nitrospiria bacterium]